MASPVPRGRCRPGTAARRTSFTGSSDRGAASRCARPQQAAGARPAVPCHVCHAVMRYTRRKNKEEGVQFFNTCMFVLGSLLFLVRARDRRQHTADPSPLPAAARVCKVGRIDRLER